MEEFLKLFKEALLEKRIYIETEVIHEYWNTTKTKIFIDNEKIVEVDGRFYPRIEE